MILFIFHIYKYLMSTTVLSALKLQNPGEIPTGFPVTIDQEGIHIATEDLPFTDLLVLPTVLPALRVAPNQTTLKVENTIEIVDNTQPNQLGVIRPYQIDCFDGSAGVRSGGYQMLMYNSSGNQMDFTNDGIQQWITTYHNSGSRVNINCDQNNIEIINSDSTQTGHLDSSFFTLQNSNTGCNTSVGTKGIAVFDDSNNTQIELVNDVSVSATPFIRMQNAVGVSNYYNQNGIIADGIECFHFDNGNRFFKQHNPCSFEITNAFDGMYIEKNMPFIFADDLSVLKLYDPPIVYLDDSGNAGWSCIISNYKGSDILIDVGNLVAYSHSQGVVQNSFTLKKWSTCRCTLVYATSSNSYLWAVSLF